MVSTETIAAIATPPGPGSVGIIRVSGSDVRPIIEHMIGCVPEPRYAKFCNILGINNEVLDHGIVLFFPGPRSFTGQDIVEFQGHGGPVVLDRILNRVISLGARLAKPGEFSERAFLNGKIDLVQAEAIADLIESASESAARLAVRTLQGDFSRRVKELVEQLIALRANVEASVDFAEEDIDVLSTSHLAWDLENLYNSLLNIKAGARQGQLLRDGMTLVIAGRPNGGKSSLLNALAGRETAIVTHVPGTTRDILTERILIDGMPLNIIDTAGLRAIDNIVEKEGVRRARKEIEQADRILWVYDDQDDPSLDLVDRSTLPEKVPLTLVRNKIDLTGAPPGVSETNAGIVVSLSAKTKIGIESLRSHLKSCVGYTGIHEGEFVARRRHLFAIDRAVCHVKKGIDIFKSSVAIELLAEELRLTQRALSEITGEFLPDDLLGEIFGRFCVGK